MKGEHGIWGGGGPGDYGRQNSKHGLSDTICLIVLYRCMSTATAVAGCDDSLGNTYKVHLTVTYEIRENGL